MLRYRSSRRLALILLVAGVSLLSIASALPTLARSRDHAVTTVAWSKIDSWVIDHTANGQSAEFLVVLTNQADLSDAAKLATKQEKGRYVYETLYKIAQETQGPIVQWLTDRGVEYRAYYIVNLIWVKADRETAIALANRSDVAKIEANPQIKMITDPLPAVLSPEKPNTPNGIEPGLSYVKAPQVWAMGFTGQGIVVGGQDTGIQWEHPALKNHYRGWNSTTSTVDHDYNWHDSIHVTGSSCGADSPFPCDDYGHGTHTMGTVLGDDGGSNQIGMAPGAKFIGCRNMNDGVGSPATYLECFEFFLAPYPVGGTPAQGNPDLAPDVTNNSWTCPIGAPPAGEGCVVDSLLAAVQAQRAAGIMTVVSAGNSGSSCATVSEPPSYYNEVYTVGALSTGTDSIASFSSRGPVTVDGSGRLKPDISAPGTNTRSAYPTNSYANLSGTSMASPHVAGAVALLWSARPQLKHNIDLTEQILNQAAVHINNATCDSAGTTWPNNTYGYGRLDIEAAVNSVPASDSALAGRVTDVSQAAIPNAVVQATASVTQTGSAVTDASGYYTLPLSSGLYTVTARAYGYHPIAVTDVNVPLNITTTQDFTLTAGSFYVVSGTVKDAQTEWPLAATIAISGYPGGSIGTNPTTGFFSVTLADDITYTFVVSSAGYLPTSRSVGPVNADQTENFMLNVDPSKCSAPSYIQYGLSESFAATTMPISWTIVGTPGWVFNDPGGRGNLTGGTGNFAIADSDSAGSVAINTELRTPVMNFSALNAVTLTFKTDFHYSGSEVADVDVSINGASGPWTNVWRKTSDYRGPKTETLNLTTLAAGQANVMLRFHYYNANFGWWWQVDDVQVGNCVPHVVNQPGLTPMADSRSGIPGSTVVYQLEMQNLSASSVAYTLQVTNTWPTELSTTGLTMTANMTDTLTVSVTIPPTATTGQTDTAIITMQGSNGSAQSLLTTSAHWPYAIYLPLIRRD